MQRVLPAQARNIVDASLRPVPSRQEFLATIHKAIGPKQAPADVALFGSMFAIPAEGRPGTEAMH